MLEPGAAAVVVSHLFVTRTVVRARVRVRVRAGVGVTVRVRVTAGLAQGNG